MGLLNLALPVDPQLSTQTWSSTNLRVSCFDRLKINLLLNRFEIVDIFPGQQFYITLEEAIDLYGNCEINNARNI